MRKRFGMEVSVERNTALEEIDKLFAMHKDDIERKYIRIFDENQEKLVNELLSAILSLKKYYPVRFLQFQIMRTDLYQNKYQIQVCGYNKKWFLDDERTVAYVDIEFLFEPFKELSEILSSDILKYMGAVSKYDIDNIVNEFFILSYNKSSSLIRKDFVAFDEWLAANNKSYRKPYRVLWGDYRGNCETLFYQDVLGKDSKIFVKECKDDKKEGHLFFSFTKCNLEKEKFSQEKFAYLNMKGSRMKEIIFDKCDFGESNFRETVMEWCSYAGNRIYGCNFSKVKGYQLDFEDAFISNSTFEEIELRKGNFSGARLIGVDFKDCNLEECCFKNATLSMVDLRAKNLEGIDLTGAKLEQVYIEEKDIKVLNLTQEQEQQVFVLS